MSNSILPEGLLRFIDNYDEKHPNECSARYRNTYELKTVDMDGNVIDTQYALNLMTDYGFNGAYKYHERGQWNGYTDRRIWIGDSTEYPKYNNNVLYSPITNSEPQGITSNYDFDHCEGMRYNKTDKICSMTRKGSSCYYDYNILDTSGKTITEDRYVREIGVGYDKNSLVMHARVYNETGELSAIIKRPNQRLYITTYYTTTMDPKIIQDNYDNGIYCAIDMRLITKQTAAEKLAGGYNSGYTANHTDVRRHSSTYDTPFYGVAYGGGGSMNHYNEGDSSIEYITNNFGGGLIERQFDYLSEAYSSCFTNGNWSAYYVNQTVYLINFNVYNEKPEEIQQTVYTNNRNTGSLSYTFGRYYAGFDPDGRIPTLDFDLQEVRAYNHETKEWDIEENFVNNNTLNLYDRWIGMYVIVKMYVTFLDKHQDVYVFINKYPDRIITSFDNSGFTLYATDTYWDSDSWEIISNLSNVPAELGSKRYYISLTYPEGWPDKGGAAREYGYYANGRGLFPIRGNETYHKILSASGNDYKVYSAPYKSYWSEVSGRTATSDKYGYVFTPTCVIYPDDIDDSTGNPYIHQVLGDGGTPIVPEGVFNFDKEDKVLVIGEPTSYQSISGSSGYFPKPLGGWYWGFRVYDMTNSDHTTAPTYQDYTVQNQLRPTNTGGDCGYYRPLTTQSSNGFVVMSGVISNSAFPYTRVINLYGGDDKNTVETYDLSGNIMGIAIDRSDFFCVYTKDEIPTIKVINVNTREVYRTFTFESGTSIRGFIGWKDYIYIHTMKNNTRFSWVYHIEDDILEYLPTEDYQILETFSNHQYGHMHAVSTSSTDDTFVIGTDIEDNNNKYYSVSYFTDVNPTHIERVMLEDDMSKINNGTGGAGMVYRSSLQVKYINGEKRQLICAYGGRWRFIVHDLGLRVDNPSDVDVKYFPFNSFRSYGGIYDRIGPAVAIYKDRIFDIQLSTSNNNTVIKETPLEYCIRHRVKGTTRTITSYNNPVNVSPIPSSSLKMINRVDSNGIPVSIADEPASGT